MFWSSGLVVPIDTTCLTTGPCLKCSLLTVCCQTRIIQFFSVNVRYISPLDNQNSQSRLEPKCNWLTRNSDSATQHQFHCPGPILRPVLLRWNVSLRALFGPWRWSKKQKNKNIILLQLSALSLLPPWTRPSLLPWLAGGSCHVSLFQPREMEFDSVCSWPESSGGCIKKPSQQCWQEYIYRDCVSFQEAAKGEVAVAALAPLTAAECLTLPGLAGWLAGWVFDLAITCIG